MDRAGANLPDVVESVGVIRGGEWGVSRSVLSKEGGRGVFPGGAAAGERAVERGGRGGNQV